jgi:putative transposase
MYSRAECTDLGIIKSRLVKLYPTKEQKYEYCYWMDVSRWAYNWTIDFIRSCQNWIPSWMEIKKYATKILPEWTTPCPFQIKGIAIKEAHSAFFRAKGRPSFRSRRNPEQSCFIPKTAIKKDGIYPLVSGKGLRYSESLPESLMDSRLIWKARTKPALLRLTQA